MLEMLTANLTKLYSMSVFSAIVFNMLLTLHLCSYSLEPDTKQKSKETE